MPLTDNTQESSLQRCETRLSALDTLSTLVRTSIVASKIYNINNKLTKKFHAKINHDFELLLKEDTNNETHQATLSLLSIIDDARLAYISVLSTLAQQLTESDIDFALQTFISIKSTLNAIDHALYPESLAKTMQYPAEIHTLYNELGKIHFKRAHFRLIDSMTEIDDKLLLAIVMSVAFALNIKDELSYHTAPKGGTLDTISTLQLVLKHSITAKEIQEEVRRYPPRRDKYSNWFSVEAYVAPSGKPRKPPLTRTELTLIRQQAIQSGIFKQDISKPLQATSPWPVYEDNDNSNDEAVTKSYPTL